MLSNIHAYRGLITNLFLWLLLGTALGIMAIPVIAFHFCYLYNRHRLVNVFLGFFFVLVLSDSRLPSLAFAKVLKTFLMLLLFLPFVVKRATGLKLYTSVSFHRPFLPFLAVAFFCIVFSPEPFTAFQKTLSYLLLLVIVPVMFYSLYKTYGTYFLKAVVYIGVIILVGGIIIYLVNPSLVLYGGGERSSGALGNPNGLGMFCLLFFLLYFTLRHYFPQLFSKREDLVILALIFSSLLWSGSRGQTAALLIFLASQFLFRRNRAAGLFVSAAMGLMLILVEIDIVAIARTLGFADFLRVETLDEGGGRVVARAFAWEQIQKSFWLGRGFDYTNYVYYQHFWELSMLGHEGNAHNSFLTVWLDTGFIGLLLYLIGWGTLFYKAAKNSFLAFPVAFAVVVSNMVESWLTASLNPFTIQLLMVLTLLVYIVRDGAPAAALPPPRKLKEAPPSPAAAFN